MKLRWLLVAFLLGLFLLVAIDERGSKNLENVDLTWDELDPKPIQAIPFKE